MTYFSVDVEADGPIPGTDCYSMTEFGAVVVDGSFDKTFYGTCRPISEKWDPKALSISGKSREEVMTFADPKITMEAFGSWVRKFETPYIFWADNNGFDWSFINWYFHYFTGSNPFGFSSKNINSLFHGTKRDLRASFKGMRKTKHTHNPVDDAKGNAEALYEIVSKYNIGGSRIPGL